MVNLEHLGSLFPTLGRKLKKISLATLPTPLRETRYRPQQQTHTVWIKEDNLSGVPYGGNKVRKLEYLLQPAIEKQRSRIATFGAVGSHHALATALYAKQLGLNCTVFLSHQTNVPAISSALRTHLRIGTEIVRFGGAYRERVRTLRQYVQDRNVWVVPAGGSSWLGTLGFIDAGLELAQQITTGKMPMPDRVYVATGTMSTTAGLALGLALADLSIDIHAVRVSHPSIANPAVLERLMRKTVTMLKNLDPTFPAHIAAHTRVTLRNEYFGAGYAHSNAVVDTAIAVAAEQFDLSLESTYTGKAMAAMLDDLDHGGSRSSRYLFWNTCHSQPLASATEIAVNKARLPAEFLRYLS